MQSKMTTEIKNAVQKMLGEGRHDPYIYASDGNVVGVRDLAVIICYYGTDPARLDATVKSFKLFSEYKARPSEILVVEAQYGEADARLEKAAGDAGFSYAFVRRDPDDAGIYIKEALMNIGVRRTSAPKIVVLDSDIGFCNPYWARNVSALLDECDMTQPFGMVYFTKNGKYEPQRVGLEPAMTRTYSRTNDKRMLNNTGLGFAFRRWVFDAIGGFDVIASPSDDMWLWSKLFEIDGSRISLFPYAKSVDGCSNRQCTKA